MLFAFAYINERYLRKSENSLEKTSLAANYDHLTKLLNRRGLESSFQEREDTQAAIALCDIDDFKKVNDRYGHSTGDLILQEVAKTFLRFSGKDQVIRWEGEEILIYMENTSLEAAQEKLNNILHYLTEKTELLQNEFHTKRQPADIELPATFFITSYLIFPIWQMLRTAAPSHCPIPAGRFPEHLPVLQTAKPPLYLPCKKAPLAADQLYRN